MLPAGEAAVQQLEQIKQQHRGAVGEAGASRSSGLQAAASSRCIVQQYRGSALRPKPCRCLSRCNRLDRGRKCNPAHHKRSCEAKQQEIAMGLGGQQVELYEPCDCRQVHQRDCSATCMRLG